MKRILKTVLKTVVRLVTIPAVVVAPIIGGVIIIALFLAYYPINAVAWVITGEEWFSVTYLPERFVDWYDGFCEKWKKALL